MSLENLDIIDVVSIDKEGNVILTVSDDLKWDNGNLHLLKLQNKLNAYLDAIDNKSLYENYPKAEGRNIIINVSLKYFPNKDGKSFLEKTKKILETEGYRFTYSNLLK